MVAKRRVIWKSEKCLKGTQFDGRLEFITPHSVTSQILQFLNTSIP